MFQWYDAMRGKCTSSSSHAKPNPYISLPPSIPPSPLSLMLPTNPSWSPLTPSYNSNDHTPPPLLPIHVYFFLLHCLPFSVSFSFTLYPSTSCFSSLSPHTHSHTHTLAAGGIVKQVYELWERGERERSAGEGRGQPDIRSVNPQEKRAGKESW